MKNVTIYTGPLCNFCDAAKRLLERNNVTYKEIDIALDTFPYNGVTTSFEAIWMGVPVLTIAGYNFNSRCGESINKNLNMEYLIAQNEEEYVSKAVELNTDLDKYYEIRKEIFKNSENSPLFNRDAFTKNFFKAIENIIN